MSALSTAVFTALVAQCVPGHSAITLAAIAQTESGRDPLTILDNRTHVAQHFRDAASAIPVTTALIAAGHVVDVGLLQISSPNFPALGLTVADAFDPCMSLKSAVQVLRWSYDGGPTPAAQQVALTGAISAYNTGSRTRGIENGYFHRVQANAGLLIPDLATIPSAEDVITPRPPPRTRSAVLEDGLHGSQTPEADPRAGMVDGLHPQQRN